MDKVTKILPRALRFPDNRTDRWGDYPHLRRRYYKGTKEIGKKLAALFKALRKDMRFAAPKLATALQLEMSRHMFSEVLICQRQLQEHASALTWDSQWEPINGLAHWVQKTTAAHPALIDAKRIACYPTRADAARRREVVMAPGKFYAAVHEPAEAHHVQTFAEQYLESKTPLQVFFIDNDRGDADREELEDEWMEKYRNPRGFTSCMSDFGVSQWHPARFYARPGNGLLLAYITVDGTKHGAVCARSIVNRDRELYVRCYGDARLARALENQGLSACAWSALKDVECNAKVNNGELVAPYLDGDIEIEWDGSSDHCTMVCDGNWCAQETSGYACSKHSATCDDCDERVDEDDLNYSAHHDRHICNCCREQNYTMAWTSRTCQELVHDNDTVSVDDHSYLDNSDVLEVHGYRWSEHENTWLHEDGCVYLKYLDDHVPIDETVELDVDHEGDSRALKNDVRYVTLCVYEDYDGPESATEVTSTRMAA